MTVTEQATPTIQADDEVTLINWERSYNPDGKVLKLIPGGYEVQWHGTKTITYENNATIELRYPPE